MLEERTIHLLRLDPTFALKFGQGIKSGSAEDMISRHISVQVSRSRPVRKEENRKEKGKVIQARPG